MTGRIGTPPRPDEHEVERRRRLARRRRNKILMITAYVSAACLVLISGAGTWIYFKLNGNIKSIAAAPHASGVQAAGANAAGQRPVNVLIMGSDTRAGKNGTVVGGGLKDSSGYGHSDTTMLMHISADHQHATVMSIPRDTVTQLPACAGGRLGQINAAYSAGGPTCARTMVETMTHIYVDHMIIIDFNGFVKMVDAVGGVPVCVPTAVNDTIGHIKLKAGSYVVHGTAALDYVREREALGDGGDRSRITRQHAFISSLIKKMESNGVLLNPATLLSLADAATKTITVDTGLNSVGKLMSFANSIKAIQPSKIKFFTVKTENYPVTMPNYATWKMQLALVHPDADAEFAALAQDAAVDTSTKSASPKPKAAVASGKGITVNVFNGTTIQGLGGRVAAALRTHHYTVPAATAARSTTHTTTIVEYAPGQYAHAKALAKLFAGSQLMSMSGTGIDLVIGTDQASGVVAGGPAKAPAAITNARSATVSACTGLTSGD
ncbi:MAG TPA: LCP family protein [Streptosporangiaceae bacterium]|nr:LCP family protein [Streptosporangiaceae bacterium]